MNDIADSGQLPDKPSLEQLRKQAKELRASERFPSLSDAQHELARRYGFASWPKLKSRVEQITLRRLIQDGEPGPVAALLKSTPGLAASPFDEGDTPLHVAAEENRPDVVELLVRHGAKFDARYFESAHTPLSWAVTSWCFEAARRLVELGDEPDLFCAAGLGDLVRVQAFWADGQLKPNPSHTGSSRVTEDWKPLPRPPESQPDQVSDALYIACRADRFDVAKWLVEHGGDPNFRAYIGATCLHWAEFSLNPALCALMREYGGSDEMLDYEFQATPRQFPVMIFSGWGFHWRLPSLVQTNPDLVRVETPTGTPLHAAARSGQARSVQTLLSAGADRNARDPKGKTPADVAEAKGHRELAAALR